MSRILKYFLAFYVLCISSLTLVAVTHANYYCAKNGSGNSPFLGLLECLLWCEGESEFHKTLNSRDETFSPWLWKPSSMAEFSRKKCAHLSNAWYKGWPRSRCRTYWTMRYGTTWIKGSFRCWNFERDSEIHDSMQRTIAEKSKIYKEYIDNEKYLEEDVVREKLSDYFDFKKQYDEIYQKKEKADERLSKFKTDYEIFVSNVKWRHKAFLSMHEEWLSQIEKRSHLLKKLKLELSDVLRIVLQPQEKLNFETLKKRNFDLKKIESMYKKLCFSGNPRLTLKALREYADITNSYVSQQVQLAESLEIPKEYGEVKNQILLQIEKLQNVVDSSYRIFSFDFDRVLVHPKICEVWNHLNLAIQYKDSIHRLSKDVNDKRSLLQELVSQLRKQERKEYIDNEIENLRVIIRDEITSLWNFYRRGQIGYVTHGLATMQRNWTSLKEEKFGGIFLSEDELRSLSEIDSQIADVVLELNSKLESENLQNLLGVRGRTVWSKAKQLKKNLDESHRDVFDKVIAIDLKNIAGIDVYKLYRGPNFKSREDAFEYDVKLSDVELRIQSFEASLLRE